MFIPSDVPPAAPLTPERTSRPHWWSEWLLLLVAALLSSLLVFWAMDLGRADLRVPFSYEGDGLLNTAIIKGIAENGWYQQNNSLGAPGVQRLYDYPVGDNLCCAMMKVLSWFTSDPGLIGNLLFLITFPLAALTACHALRALGVSAGPSLLGAVLYSALPYHFWRGTVHLYFSAYFLVPSAILLACWLATGGLLAPGEARRGRVIFAAVVAVLLGCNMVYYPFFSCFLFGVAGTLVYVQRRDARHLLAALVLIALVCVVVVANLLPHLLYVRAHGPIVGGQRVTMESELFGLKIAQLLLPVTGHRVRALAELKGRYNATHPLVNENDWVSLGFLAGLGFLALVAWLLFARRTGGEMDGENKGNTRLMGPLAVFNGAAVLLGTVGGFSTLFAVLITPQIRAYNRISVFIAFFALAAVGFGLDCVRRILAGPAGKVLFVLLLVALGVLGALDQTGADAHRDWKGLRESFRNDGEFFAKVQAALPKGSQVFQLPYEPFPEYGQPIHKMIEYSHFRAYLHTKGLRWSYGSIKGRAADLWARDVSARPVADMVEVLRRARFAGIYVDRDGYADHGAALEGVLRSLLPGTPPVVCGHGRLAFFGLELPPGAAPGDWEPPLPLPPPVWGGDFYGEERDAEGKTSWHWCGPKGEIRLSNEGDHPRRVRLTGKCVVGSGETTNLSVQGPGLEEKVEIGAAPRVFAVTLSLPPGPGILHFRCDARPLAANGDPRTLVWMMQDFRVEDVPDSP